MAAASSGKPKDEQGQSGKKTVAKKQQSTLKERLIKAIAHPLRYQILTKLNDREWSPNQLADELAEGLSQVSYHIKVLRDFELIEMTNTEPRRGAVEHFYRATQRPIIPLDMARRMPKSGRHVLIGDILGEINDDVNEAVGTETFDSRDDYHCDRIPLILDDQGCKDAHALGDEFIDDILDIASDSAKRLQTSSDAEPLTVTAVLLMFPSVNAKRDMSPRNRRRKATKKRKKKSS